MQRIFNHFHYLTDVYFETKCLKDSLIPSTQKYAFFDIVIKEKMI